MPVILDDRAVEKKNKQKNEVPRRRSGKKQGSMLLSQFLPIFGEKIGVFLKNQCYDPIFA
jgi:hypothetical protein